MKSALSLAVATALAVAAPPALGQPAYEQQQYERQLREYEAQQREYQARRSAYEAAQREYELRYGAGAYDRYYGNRYPPPPPPAPYYDSRDPYPRDPYPVERYGNEDPYRYYADSPCERRNASNPNRDANTFAGGLIGALAGAAIGSNVASDNARDEGAVLGAVAGAAIGIGIARSADSDRYVARCDAAGYYYTSDQTYPYQESRDYGGRLSGRYDYDYYMRQRCRLAVAPAWRNGRSEYRYVRVCPDSQGLFRITS